MSPSSPPYDSAETQPGVSDTFAPGLLALFLQLLPVEVWNQMRHRQKLRQNNRVYTLAVVTWLMIVQRLQGPGTLHTAVLELLRDRPPSFWPQPCKRLPPAPAPQPRLLANHTGT